MCVGYGPLQVPVGGRRLGFVLGCCIEAAQVTIYHLTKYPMKRSTFSTLCLIALYLCVMQSYASLGQPGTPDVTFGSNGKVITPVGTGADVAYALVLQPDGKVVIAGSCNEYPYGKFCAVRYNAVGTLDTSFGTEGKVITTISGGVNYPRAMVIQLDGKLVIAGYCYIPGPAFCALRYTENGLLDDSFGTLGIVLTSFNGSYVYASAMALQPDGKLLLVGDFESLSCTVRYNGNGTLDTTFGAAGKVCTGIGSLRVKPTSVLLQPDGKLVLAGGCGTGQDIDNDFCALRYNADGSLDSSFGNEGKLVIPIGLKYDNATALARQPDGKLVLVGMCVTSVTSHYCAVRLLSDGTLDQTFGIGGKVISEVTANGGIARAVVLQPDGKLVLVGACNGVSGFDFCVVRLNDNGTRDGTYGANGAVVTPIGNGIDEGQAAALQPDGKLLVAGYCLGSNTDFCAARYEGGPFSYKNCSLDIDGDNRVLPATDSVIHARIALGIVGNAVVSGITFPATATRNTWPLIRHHLVTQCGMSLVQ